jgi:hypothetical protein
MNGNYLERLPYHPGVIEYLAHILEFHDSSPKQFPTVHKVFTSQLLQEGAV